MKIGFDAKRLFNNFTGLGNYSRFVVQSLLEFEQHESLVLFTPKAKKLDHPDIKPIATAPQVEVITPSGLYRWAGMTSLWRSFGIGAERSAQSLDVFHGLSQELPSGLPARVRKIVTVHDLIFLRYPQLYGRIDARIYHHKVKNACADADVVICISQQTAQDVMAFLKTPEEKIVVIYQGTHPQFVVQETMSRRAEITKKWGLPSTYILTVGTIEPRKNLLSVVKALAGIPKEMRLPLVVIGRETAYKDTVVEEAARLDVLDEIIFLHRVPFADLPAIYQGSSLFLYPSLFEGFGIPILEALQSRVPVISSTGSCFMEAGGTHSLYADPSDSDQLAAHILHVLTDSELRQTMIAQGLSHAQSFSPEKIANALMRVYRK